MVAISVQPTLSYRPAVRVLHPLGIFARLAIFLWMCLGVRGVWAGKVDCIVPETLPAKQIERRAALHALDLQRAHCLQNADWYAQRGALLLALGHASEAAESLERAILLAPDHAGARMDYADALAALGDMESASALAESLLALPGIPAAARDHLVARLGLWQVPKPDWQFIRELGAGLAWESNLNGGPVASTIGLTLPEGLLNVEVLPGERPQSGFADSYDVGITALRRLGGDSQLLLRTQVRGRDASGASNDYLLAQFDVSLVRPLADAERIVQFSHNEQIFGGHRLLAETRVLAQHQWLLAPCAPALGADASLRRFPATHVLDSHQLAFRLGAQCRQGGWQANAQLRLALDEPLDADRPGGRQQWAELRLGAAWQGIRYGARLDVGMGYIGDRNGYSPFLDAGQVRTVLRRAARVELTRALDRHWELAASIDWFRQRASLAIFEIDNLGLYFGARYRY